MTRKIWTKLLLGLICGLYLSGCGSTLNNSHYSASDRLSYPKLTNDADRVITLISNKDNTRFTVDGKSLGNPISAGGELKILVNNQPHEFVASAPGYQTKSHQSQPPYDENSPISFSFIYKDKLEGTTTAVADAPSPVIFSPASAAMPIATANADPLPVPQNTSGFGAYVALIIGNERYAHTRALRTAIDDAESLKALLERKYGFQVTLIHDGTRHNILGALADLQKHVNENTNVLIYYAGHGHYEKAENRGYWLPVDAEQDNPDNWIANDDITSRVKAMTAKHVLVIADSCYSGTLTRSSDFRGLVRETEENQSGSKSTSDYLNKLARKKTRMVLTSGGLEPVVDAGGSGNHSVFSSAILKTLEESNGVMEGTLLFSKIREKVSYNADQTPEYSAIKNAGHEGGDFLFVPKH